MDGNEKNIIDIQKQMKDAGLVYREPTDEMKKHPKYLLVQNLLKDLYVFDISKKDD